STTPGAQLERQRARVRSRDLSGIAGTEDEPGDRGAHKDEDYFEVQQRRDDGVVRVAVQNEVKALERGQRGVRQRENRLERREEQNHDEVDAGKEQHCVAIGHPPRLDGAAGLLLQQQPCDPGVDQDHEDFQHEQRPVDEPVLRGRGEEIETSEDGYLGVCDRVLIEGREEQQEGETPRNQPQYDLLTVVDSDPPFLSLNYSPSATI